MVSAFIPHIPLRATIIARRPRICRTSPTASQGTPASPSDNLYHILGLPHTQNGHASTHAEIRAAYLNIAKVSHPDVASDADSVERFAAVARAWAVLGDDTLRRIYDSTGADGIAAIRSIDQRTADIRRRFAGLDGDALDYLADSGQLIGGLLSPAEDPMPPAFKRMDSPFNPGDIAHDDACPRSVEEAIWNIQFHDDISVRYYGLWWIYKFKVSAAEEALVNVLRTSTEQTVLGGFKIRRRAALALGAVATAPTQDNTDTVLALTEAMKSRDYFLRYRAAEALSNLAQRTAMNSDVYAAFPDEVVNELKRILKMGQEEFKRKEAAKSGYSLQEGLFDLDKFEPEVRKRLENIFEDRRKNESVSRRTTMTPQLGVDEVGTDADEPFEWILKAVSAICSQSSHQDQELTEILQTYTKFPVPLVRYAAHKALFALTGKPDHAEEIVKALQYGVEHHYSQRVLIRDLGDLGYSQGAAAVAACPMVENSFKILALKNMLAKRDHDPEHEDVRNVLLHMDSLL